MTAIPLTPAEAFVLLDPKRALPSEAFKIAFLGLIAKGVLKVASVERKGIFRTRKIPIVSVAGEPDGTLLARAITHVVHQSKPTSHGIELTAVAKAAVAEFGQALLKIKTDHILPALERRHLVTAEKTRVLGLFATMRYRLTPAGEAEVARIQAILDRARTLPALLNSNPEEAKAIALAAGALLLLVPELKAHYGQLARLNPAVDTGGGDSGGNDGSLDFANSDAGTTELPQAMSAAIDGDAFGSFDCGTFDFGAFDSSAFDMDFSSFDASFDSSFDGGGGDSGGGDSGGSTD